MQLKPCKQLQALTASGTTIRTTFFEGSGKSEKAQEQSSRSKTKKESNRTLEKSS